MILLRTISKAAALPSQVLSLSAWDLALPVNPDGELFNDFYTGSCASQTLNPSPAALGSNAALARALCDTIDAPGVVGLSNAYFNVQAGAVQFIAPVWGATTSTNTKSPRCELRSRVTGSGSTKAGDFTPDNMPSLRIVGSVVRRSNANGKVHIAQIHADTTTRPSPQRNHASSDVYLIVSFNSAGQLVSEVTAEHDSTVKDAVNIGPAGVPLRAVGSSPAYDLTITQETLTRLRYVGTVNGVAVNQAHDFPASWPTTWTLVNMYAKAGAYSSGSALCGDDAAVAKANGYLLPANAVTDYFQTSIHALSLTLLNP